MLENRPEERAVQVRRLATPPVEQAVEISLQLLGEALFCPRGLVHGFCLRDGEQVGVDLGHLLPLGPVLVIPVETLANQLVGLLVVTSALGGALACSKRSHFILI